VKDKLNDIFDVTGLVKPGTVINALTSTAKGDMENLTVNDVIVFGVGPIMLLKILLMMDYNKQ
jgi:hypothetical protein